MTELQTRTKYTYDAENRITTGAGVTYTYDGDGRRVKKSSGKLYWYGTGSDPLDETDLAGATTNSTFKEFIFFSGKRIASRDFSNNVNYYFSDHLGTARVVANSSGTVLDDSDFYPFGGERIVTSSSGNTYKFTGKERDTESGLDEFGARYYDSAFGRFMSVDLGPHNLELPQTLNRYTYVNNNPLKFIDPTGNEAEFVIDKKKKTITLTVTVAVWGPGATREYADKLKNALESTWKGTYTDPKTGQVWKISTKADVSVYSPGTGEGLTAKNGFYVGDDVSRSFFRRSPADPKFSGRYPGDNGMYTGAMNPNTGSAPHEMGHVVGQPDDYWEDANGATGPQPGHEGHLMAGAKTEKAAQDELDRIGSYTLNQAKTTGRSDGTIIKLPEPEKPH